MWLTLQKNAENLISNYFIYSYQSGNAKTQIDFILLTKRNLKMAKDIKVILSEECVPQHKLLICELRLKTQKPHPQTILSKTSLLEVEGTNCTRRVRAGIQVQGECI